MFFGSLTSKCLLLILGKAPALLPPARLEEARDSGPCELTLINR